VSHQVVDVVSEMIGSVALRRVDDGAKVEAGDAIVDIECMKTFWPIHAPVAGIVTHRVDLGAVVGQDEVVAVIEVEF
jgi:biotin carboxyl carrier protein